VSISICRARHLIAIQNESTELAPAERLGIYLHSRSRLELKFVGWLRYVREKTAQEDRIGRPSDENGERNYRDGVIVPADEGLAVAVEKFASRTERQATQKYALIRVR
jgi:hypothetical protein